MLQAAARSSAVVPDKPANASADPQPVTQGRDFAEGVGTDH